MSEAAVADLAELAEGKPIGLEDARPSWLTRAMRPLATPAGRASIWTIVCYGATQALRLVSNVVLSRLLFPEAFGVMTIVNVFVQGLQMFSDLGIGPSIIQHRRGDERLFLNTAWTLQVVRGFCLAGCSIALAWPLAVFYDTPQLGWLLCAAGITAAISGFNSTYLFTVRRSLSLGGVTLLEIGAQAAGVLVNCVWALVNPSVWALMAGALVSAFVRAAFSHVLNHGERDRMAWDATAYHELFHFGKWIFLSTIITFCAGQCDRILLSKLIPLEMLGVYTVALTLALLPNVLLSTLAFSVLYPLLCKAGREVDSAINDRLLRGRRTLLLFGMTLVLCIGAGADAFFRLLYDPRYFDAIWMTQLMCVSVWFMVLNTTLEISLLALGDSRANTFCGFVKFAACTVVSLVLYHFYSTPGFILGIGIGAAVGQGVLLLMLARHGVSAVRQDACFTAATAALALAAVVAERFISYGAVAVCMVVPLGVAAMYVRHHHGQHAHDTASAKPPAAEGA